MLVSSLRFLVFFAALLVPLAGARAQDSSESSPTGPSLTKLLATAEEKLFEGEYAAAKAGFTAALEIEESSAAYLGRGRAIFWDEGQESQALPDIERAIELDPKNTEALFTRYELHNWLGKEATGREELLTHVKGHDFEPASLVEICEWSSATEDSRLTRDLLDFSFERHGDLTGLLVVRGELAYYNDDFTQARRDLELARTRPDVNPWAYAVLAECQLFQGDLEVALLTSEDAVRLDPSSAAAYFIRGRIRYQLDDPQGAAKDLARAVEIEPFYEDWDFADDPDFDVSFSGEFGGLLIFLLGFLALLGVLGLAVGGLREGRREAPRRQNGTQPRYDGEWRELLGIYLQNLGLTLVTFGGYRFWAKVRTRRFHYQHSSFAAGFNSEGSLEDGQEEDEQETVRESIEGRFDYHATGKEKFIGFLKGMLILVPMGIGLLWLDGRFAESQGQNFAGVVLTYGLALTLYLLRPLILVGSQRFNLSRTSWNNLRFRFTGTVGQAYKLYARDFALMLVTFGIYWSWHAVRVRAFRLRNTALGEETFEFRGQGEELFKINFFGTVLTYLTVGLYSPWFFAKRYQFFVSNTRFRGKPWKSDLTGRQVLGVGGTGALVTLLTLGLGLPWAITRWRHMLTHSTFYQAQVDGEQLATIADAAASSTVEGLGEAGELLGEIGDLFGI